MRWRDRPIVAFDTETTGLDLFGGDRVVEFAAVVLWVGADGRPSSQEVFSWLVNPGIPIPRASTEVTGITDKDVADKPPFAEVADEVRRLLHGQITVAHNYPFDRNAIGGEFRRIGQRWPEPLAEVDTVDVSRSVFKEAKEHKLAALCQRLDVSLVGAHRASNDALATGRALLEMARRHEVPDDLTALLDWANAVGPPPADGPFVVDNTGRVIFHDGPHAGLPVEEHPLHLHWMTKARARADGAWDWRFPEGARRWARRWLEVRGAGRTRASGKSPHPTVWGLDPCFS